MSLCPGPWGRSAGARSSAVSRLAWLGFAAVMAGMVVPALAGVIFSDDFETLGPRWKKNIRGQGSIEIVPGGVKGKCLRVTSQGAMVYLTTELDAAQYAGTTIEIVGMVKLDNVKQGRQVYSTAKFHLAQWVRGETGPRHAAARWTGTFDWTEKKLSVPIDEKATKIVIDLGLQNATGTAYFDNLVVRDAYGIGRPVSLAMVANTSRSDGVAGDGRGGFLDTGMDDLFELPGGNLETDEVTFYVPERGDNGGRTCAILKGRQRPNFPTAVGPMPVGKKVASLYFLLAAAWVQPGGTEPCLTCRVIYQDGQEAEIVMMAGRDVGDYHDPQDLPNWKVVWQARNGAGKRVGVGMAKWTNPRPQVPVRELRLESAGRAVPIVLAITYVPPKGQSGRTGGAR